MILDYKPKEFSGDQSAKELGRELARLQHKILNSDEKIAYIILLEGWESSGRGHVMRDIMRELDQRYIEAFPEHDPWPEVPYPYDFWQGLPQYGRGTIFAASSYEQIFKCLGLNEDIIDAQIKHLRDTSQTLYDDNFIIIKLFLDVSEEVQRNRMESNARDPYRNLYVSRKDLHELARYEAMRRHFNQVLTKSNFATGPWHVISATDLKQAGKEALTIVIKELSAGLEQIEAAAGLEEGEEAAEKASNGRPAAIDVSTIRPNRSTHKRIYKEKTFVLDGIDPYVKLSRQEHDERLEALQQRASDLQLKLKEKEIPTIIAFEGMDAAGKGGAIKRLTRLMDPRFCLVSTTAAPTEHELSYHYLWRFYTNFPSYGNITIFDRSWYGRVLVERVECFASPAEWERAYDEINKMEAAFCQHRGLVLKYYIHIDKDEQAARFKDRMEDKDKQYKITDEDWRNRDKWDLYWEAANEMLVRTSTECAPWKVIPGNNKRAARIMVLEDFIDRAESALEGTRFRHAYHPF